MSEATSGSHTRASDVEGTDISGLMLELGQGVEKDVVQAMNFYRKAADAGDSAAMVRLGERALVKQGETESAQWFAKQQMPAISRHEPRDLITWSGYADIGRIHA